MPAGGARPAGRGRQNGRERGHAAAAAAEGARHVGCRQVAPAGRANRLKATPGKDVFTDYFDSQGLASEPTAFSGRSDYGPFIAVGIPAGGLFTGAEGTKTPEQVALYGGLATFEGEPVSYDPCYHQGCDSLEQEGTQGYDPDLYAALDASYAGALEGNVNTKALDEMSDAAAHGVMTFAMTSSAVGGTAKGGGSGARAGTLEFKGSHQQK